MVVDPDVGSLNRASHWWMLCRIAPGGNGSGYDTQVLPDVRTFMQQTFLQETSTIKGTLGPDGTANHQSLAVALLVTFRAMGNDGEIMPQVLAGLCLRCWMSHSILRTCMKLANLFGGAKQFSYQDLLPFVLTDDGQQYIVPGSDDPLGDATRRKARNTSEDMAEGTSGKPRYYRVGKTGELEALSYVCFSLEALQRYQADKGLSLTNWVYLQTKQHPELTTYLAEFGFQKLSDWALLNRVRSGQLEQLSVTDRELVTVFHGVYRRDRTLSHAFGRCPDPTEAQLEEMHRLLSVTVSSTAQLLKSLKHVATQLRQFDVWQSREPLEFVDAETGQAQVRADLPMVEAATETLEQAEMRSQLHQQLMDALKNSLHQAIITRIAKLQKSKKYRPFANAFTEGLQYYYRDGLSLKEITPLLGTSSWDQTRRILNPGQLVASVRSLTLQQCLAQTLLTVQEKAFISWPPSPDYLQHLSEQLEAFADSEIFQQAVAEMKAGSHRKLDSPYAHQLLLILPTIHF